MSIVNIAKWELRKYAPLRWFVLPWLALLLVAYLLPESVTHWSWVTKVFGPLLSIAMGLGLVMVYLQPGLSMLMDLRAKHGLLEKTRNQPFVITAVTKIVFNVLLFSLGWGLMLLNYEILQTYSTGVWVLLLFPYTEPVIYIAITAPIVVMFAIVATPVVPIIKNLSLVGQVVLGIVMGYAIFALGYDGMLSGNVLLAARCAAVLLLFILSCWLYDNKYEITSR